MKIASILIILSSMFISSCCTFCNIESTIEYEIDTMYFVDTVTVNLATEQHRETTNDLYATISDLIKASLIIDSLMNVPIDTFTIIKLKDVYLSITSDTIYGETSYANAAAGISNGELWLLIENKEKAVAYADSLKIIVLNNFITTVDLKDSNDRLRDKFKRYRFIAFISTGLLIFFLILIVAYRRIIIKGMNSK